MYQSIDQGFTQSLMYLGFIDSPVSLHVEGDLQVGKQSGHNLSIEIEQIPGPCPIRRNPINPAGLGT